MESIITQLAKYLILIIMILFTFQCFNIFKKRDIEDKQHVLRKQIILILLFNLVSYGILYIVL